MRCVEVRDAQSDVLPCPAGRWTQWIFLQLFKRGLAYQAEVPVNWCPALGTVLANEEVGLQSKWRGVGGQRGSI